MYRCSVKSSTHIHQRSTQNFCDFLQTTIVHYYAQVKNYEVRKIMSLEIKFLKKYFTLLFLFLKLVI